MLVETVISANNGFEKQGNKRMLFPLDKSSDYIRQNEGFVKKTSFH